MGRKYATNGSAAVASPTKTLLTLVTATTVRPRIYDLLIGSVATPADNALDWLLQRFTAPGTVTSVTPSPLDPSDPASLCASGKNASVEPTYTSALVLLEIAMNQRSTQRWVAAPGGELVLPATASNGVGVQPVHSSFTGSVNACIHFEE